MTTPFSLLIKPASADCNLRCDYCFYLDHAALYPETKIHRMSEDVLERMVSSFLAQEQEQYVFAWQGGEPTMMGLPFFKRVTELQQTYGRKGAVVGNGLQTNGTLIDDAWVSHLAQYRFLLGVSLDGPETIHDKYRCDIQGKGSHARVIKGIQHLNEKQVAFNILSLVSQANVHDARMVFHYYLEQGFQYHQYIPCVEFDADGNRLPFAITGAEWGDFLCTIFDAWLEAGYSSVSVRLFDSILTLLVLGRANDCHMMPQCANVLVIEYNGDVYPCDFFVEPHLKLGNIMEMEWEELLHHDRFQQFRAQKSRWNERCNACDYVRFCAGDCLKNRFVKADDPKHLSWLCEGWSQFYSHALPKLKQIATEIQQRQQQSTHPTSVEQKPQKQKSFQETVDRNDPCPCGSGLKYKKCCMRSHF
jgi:uncharacterized protein